MTVALAVALVERMLRLRWDKPVDEADTLETLRALIAPAPAP